MHHPNFGYAWDGFYLLAIERLGRTGSHPRHAENTRGYSVSMFNLSAMTTTGCMRIRW